MSHQLRHVLKAVILATARRRELALPDPIGIVLPAKYEYIGVSRLHDLPVVLMDTERFGLIVPLEEL